MMNAAMKLKIAVMAGAFIGSPTWLAFAQTPIEKLGSCPSGYHTSSNYCAPSSSSSRPALPRIGACPSGYHASGAYCLASSGKTKPAIIKKGPCPARYHASGGYCLKT